LIGVDKKLFGKYIKESPHDVVFFDNLKFKDCVFAKDTLKSDKPLSFRGSEFTDCEFNNCIFINAQFGNWCKFDRTVFDGCSFEGALCDFTSAQFNCESYPFEQCNFYLQATSESEKTKVKFTDAAFDVPRAIFRLCYARTDVFTLRALRLSSRVSTPTLELFVANAGFQILVLGLCIDKADLIDMDNIRIQGHFIYQQLEYAAPFAPELVLSRVNFASMASAQFFDANLKRITFNSSSIETVKFHNCIWEREDGYCLLPKDETIARTDPQLAEELTRLYVQLKRNYESNGNFIDAGDWFYREMEARRNQLLARSSRWPVWMRRSLSLISLYKIAANYGQSFTRPLIGLVISVIGFALAYFYGGFTLGQDYVRYRLCVCPPTLDSLYDFGRAVGCSLSAVTLQVGRVSHLEGIVSVFAYLIQILVTATLLSLFLLSVRRRFRR